MKDKDEETTSHESFGQIRFGRINGRAKFYGSELEQDNYIELEIDNSEVTKSLTTERYFSRKNLVKVRMSSGQFSNLITSLNVGGGTPCTIERIGDKIYEPLPDVMNRKKFVHNQFKERMQDFAKNIKEKQLSAKNLIKKKNLSRENMEELTKTIDWLTREISSNVPYFMECFQESMDIIVNEAKLEVENAIQHKISVLGLAELHKENRLFLGSDGE
jgi:Glu-tRNA(Gln) amidotransferase subunit E-like FAD-binding protein